MWWSFTDTMFRHNCNTSWCLNDYRKYIQNASKLGTSTVNVITFCLDVARQVDEPLPQKANQCIANAAIPDLQVINDKTLTNANNAQAGADLAKKVGGGAMSAIFDTWSSLITASLLKEIWSIYFTTLLWKKNGRQNGLAVFRIVQNHGE